MNDFRAIVEALPPFEGRIRVDERDGVTEIVIDHPRTKNALDPRMMLDLSDAFDAAAGARVVILRGEGGSFCSGGNLGAVRRHLLDVGPAVVAFMQRASERLSGLDAIVIGVATGPALGGGAELLAACDLVVAAPDASIGWVQARLGVSPGFGGGARLVARVGSRVALRLLCEARPVPAPEAAALGLVDVIAEDALSEARAFSARFLEMDAEALRAAKRVVRASATLPPEEARAVELDAFSRLWGGPAHRRALGA